MRSCVVMCNASQIQTGNSSNPKQCIGVRAKEQEREEKCMQKWGEQSRHVPLSHTRKRMFYCGSEFIFLSSRRPEQCLRFGIPLGSASHSGDIFLPREYKIYFRACHSFLFSRFLIACVFTESKNLQTHPKPSDIIELHQLFR